MFFNQPVQPETFTPKQVKEIEDALKVLVKFGMMSRENMLMYMAQVVGKQEVIDAEWRLVK